MGETLEFILEFMCETDIRVLTSNNGGVGVGTCFFFFFKFPFWDGMVFLNKCHVTQWRFFYSYIIYIRVGIFLGTHTHIYTPIPLDKHTFRFHPPSSFVSSIFQRPGQVESHELGWCHSSDATFHSADEPSRGWHQRHGHCTFGFVEKTKNMGWDD